MRVSDSSLLFFDMAHYKLVQREGCYKLVYYWFRLPTNRQMTLY